MKRFFAILQLFLVVAAVCVPMSTNAACGEKTVQRTYSTVNGECTEEVEACDGKTTVTSCCLCTETSSDRGKTVNVNLMRGTNGYTYSSCQELCKKTNGVIYRQAGAGALPPDVAAASLAQVQEQAKYCFTASDCASEEYGGSLEAFRAGYSCPSGQGRCVAPEPQVELSFPIGNIKTVAGLRGFVSTAFNYATGIAAVAAAIMFVWGGLRYIFGSAFQNIKRAKEIMVDASVGLALTLGAMVILRAVNPTTLDLNKLEVFMINKEQFLNQNFCADVTDPQGKKDFQFADAGPAPAFTPIGQIKDTDYTIPQEKTKCNYEYYIKGFGDSRCKGRACDEPGTVCIPCTSGYCGQSSGFVCQRSTIAGTVTYEGNRALKAIKLMAVCGSVFDGVKGDKINQNYRGYIFPMANGTITDAGPSRQGYSVSITQQDISDAEKKCENYSGFFTYALAMQYEDASIIPAKLNDYAVIHPAACNTVGIRFGSYLNGGAEDLDAGLALVTACAVGNEQPWAWNKDNIKRAVDDGKAITCDLGLNATTAPEDPGGDISTKDDGKHKIMYIDSLIGTTGNIFCGLQ
jgi:hypothetical protein